MNSGLDKPWSKSTAKHTTQVKLPRWKQEPSINNKAAIYRQAVGHSYEVGIRQKLIYNLLPTVFGWLYFFFFASLAALVIYFLATIRQLEWADVLVVGHHPKLLLCFLGAIRQLE